MKKRSEKELQRRNWSNEQTNMIHTNAYHSGSGRSRFNFLSLTRDNQRCSRADSAYSGTNENEKIKRNEAEKGTRVTRELKWLEFLTHANKSNVALVFRSRYEHFNHKTSSLCHIRRRWWRPKHNFCRRRSLLPSLLLFSFWWTEEWTQLCSNEHRFLI